MMTSWQMIKEAIRAAPKATAICERAIVGEAHRRECGEKSEALERKTRGTCMLRGAHRVVVQEECVEGLLLLATKAPLVRRDGCAADVDA